MTEKLFYQNAYLRTFSATVTGCKKAENGWQITLDRTAFYPEGGGQPGDTGLLGGVRVLDTFEQGETLIHLCDAPLQPGSAVSGEIDWARRFDFMQQHSGEHIISGLIFQRYGLQNAGFHMGAQTVTVDLSGILDESQLSEIEREANEIVWQNVPLQELYPTESELGKIDFRSKKELHGWVRLIDIPGADRCACCGMHVAATGAIGLIKILSVQHFRAGVRLEMLCGKRAYDYVNLNAGQNRQISALLSAQLHETAVHVQRLLDDKSALDYQLTGLQRARLASLAKEAAGQTPALIFEPDLDADSLRRLCTAMMEHTCGVCAAFTGSDADGYKYAIARLEPELLKAFNAALQGRGGGKPGFAQGSVQANEFAVREWFSLSTEK